MRWRLTWIQPPPAPLPPAELLTALRRDPDALIASGRMLKDGDRSTVVALEGFAPRAFMLKRYNFKGFAHTAVHSLMRSRASWSFRNAILAMESGLPTPRPVAMLETRFGPLRGRSFFLTEHVDGRALLELVREGSLPADQLQSVVDQFARIWQRLGERRLSHGDMKGTNFILDPHMKLWLIDLDGLRLRTSDAALIRERRKDLERFMRNWTNHPEVAAAFRDRLGESGWSGR